MGAHGQTLIALGAALSLGAAAAQPALPEGEKSLIAVTLDGQRTRIGTVAFGAANAGRASFRVRMDHAVMQDHFLSMREFKCLPATQEITCFVPYPYPHPGTVSASDFSWLEHNLLFFFKQPADFGAKLWNGVIFKFSLTPSGLVGTPQAVDLNRIGVPPERPDEPPYGRFDRDDFTPGARWVQELRIE
ncbi:MAG TPA: hypothetical protein PKC60_03485 [Hydrogenophaga sp.]|uniref:hypothetical protein n=1 Tax=Hydrogenophaga sp. TaxID=1904254 RepID=UPI002C77ADF4|nr:hypothetical protein [Hydrogenophaga sp.]HMN92272.1 hypothetical protein [Hydrogenophaga sp.]HMP09307.1 hypothetical protein [Hydrogenophaga sp.]